jgi:glycosyltransferase involved in cell wall biosynthesis
MSFSTLPDVAGYATPASVLPFPMFPPKEISRPSAASRSPNPQAPTPFATIRALHLVNGEHYSGAERAQDLMAGQLPRFGCDVGFVCVKPRKFPTVRESKDTPLLEMPMRGRFDFRVVRRITNLVRDEGYQLIHAHTPRTALVGRLAARRAGVPLVYHVHSPAGRDSTRRLLNRINALVEWAAVRDADRVIVVCPSLREYMLGRGIEAHRIACVPYGVPSAAHGVRRRSPADAWTFGMIALFRPRKGIEVLLEALAALRSRGLNVRLRAVGGFETPMYESTVHALVARLGLEDSIDWIGFTRGINRELAKMDALVLPSLFGEGLPLVVLEAMAAGVPVIASRVEGVPEAVAHRATGLIVEPGSVSQLSRAVEEMVAGKVDHATLSRNAKARHAELFSDATMAAGVNAVYREVLSSLSVSARVFENGHSERSGESRNGF